MKPKEYDVLVMAVEHGVEFGWMRAHKYADHPDEEAIKAQMVESILHEVCEWFNLDGDGQLDIGGGGCGGQ